MKKIFYISTIVLALLAGCENAEWKYPDFDYSTVYFAYQAPVRTITLGEDIYDNSLDNEYKFMIMATLGGVYENNKNVVINVVVDNTLCDDSLSLVDASGNSTIAYAMPSSYYSLPSNMQITIPSGKMMGGIEVQLTDAFFEDTLALENHYVIPLIMTQVIDADSILSGNSELTNPDRRKAGDWSVVPKDYVLYVVKYINPWHGYYLRRGVNEVTGNGGNTALNTTWVYRAKYVEQDEVCNAVTKALNEVSIVLNTKKDDGITNRPFELILSFDNANNCIISGPDTATYAAAGAGKFVKKGDRWGDKDRDVLHLNYTIDFGTTTQNFTDTLVIRNRGVQFETLDPLVP